MVPRSRDVPCDWQPSSVMNPKTEMFFDDFAAWHHIADLAEEGHAIEIIVLEKPAGKKGAVMTVELPAGQLYIKVQLNADTIYGRSFHYSTRRATQ